MKNLLTCYRTIATLLIALALLATLAACASPSTANGGGGSGSPSATTPPAPTATPKPKPTGVPTITTALCQQLMTVDEANTLMQPKVPATKILADDGGDAGGGSCNYQATPTDYPLIIYFLPWNGPNPIPQSDIAAALSQATSNNMTVNQATPVSGIGDQAEYLDASGTYQGHSGVIHIFYVLDGKMIFDCFTFNVLSGGAVGSQSQLQACATQVYNRL